MARNHENHAKYGKVIAILECGFQQKRGLFLFKRDFPSTSDELFHGDSLEPDVSVTLELRESHI